jgi:hypothetical protein
MLRRIFGRKKKAGQEKPDDTEALAMREQGETEGPISPDGLVCVASTREPDRSKLPAAHDRFEAVPLTEKRAQYKCGHEDFAKFKLDIYGEAVELNDKFWKERPECSTCHIARMKPFIPRCALCGLPIYPGDGVAVYAYARQFKKKPWVYRVGPDGEAVLGCTRWECCPSGGFFAGHWDGEKFVSAFDGKSMAEAVMSDGRSRIVNDMRAADDKDKK